MSAIRFAIVGYGFIGRRHAEILRGHPDCELVAVCEPNAEKTAELEGVAVFRKISELLSAELNLDVVCICTPNGVHADQAIIVLEANTHVVIEKPMGLHKAHSEKVLFTALKHGKLVFVVMQNRYSPTAIWLREMVDSGRLGRIHAVQVNCFWNRGDGYYAQSDWKGTQEMDGGPLFTQFSHFVDILYWLFGDITDISATFDNFSHQHNTEFEDSGLVNFRFQAGGIGSINYSTAVYDRNFESSITILAEHGTVRVGGQYMERIDHCHVHNYSAPELPPASPPNDYGIYKGSAANHHYIFENVVQTLRGGATITTNALEGLKVVEIIERIYALR